MPAPHLKAKALKPGSPRPAKDLCSDCGLCDTHFVHYVKDACAFLNQQFVELETQTHGRSRDLDQENDVYFGVHQQMLTAQKKEPIAGAQNNRAHQPAGSAGRQFAASSAASDCR